MADKLMTSALSIAIKSLRACYVDNGIIAGNHHFTDYWARDGYFAAFGSLALKDTEIVSKMVDLFFANQRHDGLIPYLIRRGPISISKYFGHQKLYKYPKPNYRLRNIGQEIYDGTTLSVLFAALTSRTQYIPQIKKALAYLEGKEKHGLLWDGPMGEWNDAVWKWGNLLYSNIIYWYMYDRLTHWSVHIDQQWSVTLKRKTNMIAQSLRARLWNGTYFADWNDYQRQDYLYPFGNCLAIVWGLTTTKESQSILAACSKLKKGFTLETNDPSYPWWRIDMGHRLIGMGDYQDHGILWWQPITSYLAALQKTRSREQIHSTTQRIVEQIIKTGIVHECYERDGNPVKRMIYQSESPFAWASGMIIWSLYNDRHAK